jgi:hypothetical protein
MDQSRRTRLVDSLTGTSRNLMSSIEHFGKTATDAGRPKYRAVSRRRHPALQITRHIRQFDILRPRERTRAEWRESLGDLNVTSMAAITSCVPSIRP